MRRHLTGGDDAVLRKDHRQGVLAGHHQEMTRNNLNTLKSGELPCLRTVFWVEYLRAKSEILAAQKPDLPRLKGNRMRSFTAVIERCPDTGFYVGYVPGFPGAHSQGESLEELNRNLKEVIELLLEEGEPRLEAEFVGTQNLVVA